jgi:hypothetical protein
VNIKIGHKFASLCDWPLSITFFLVNIFCDSPLKQGICMIHQRATPFLIFIGDWLEVFLKCLSPV